MKIVDFYRGKTTNQAGNSLDDIMNFSLGAMEIDHDYIQWMFPSNELSGLNRHAPVLDKEQALVFSSDVELQEKLKKSFEKFIGFLGFELIEEGDNIFLRDMEPHEGRKNPQEWLTGFNHNMLRVTRILKCMRLTGLSQYSLALYEKLLAHRERFSENTFSHWTRATMDPLW